MKRFTVLSICLIVMVSLFCGSANATTYASDYLSDYHATLSTGVYSGQLKLTFYTTSLRSMTSIGISNIEVYSSDGSYVKAINGSTSNGLLANFTYVHNGTYTITATPGESYYLQVTFVAKDSSGEESKQYTTNTAVAAK